MADEIQSFKGKRGGWRPGAGRPKGRTSADIRQELQKRLPKALKIIDLSLKRKEKISTADAWKVIDKFLPDISATEISGKDGKSIPIYIVGGGFIPPDDTATPLPRGSDISLPAPIQSDNLAQESKEDNNSSNRVSEADTA